MSNADLSNGPQPAQLDRLLQLLADRATEGLDHNDQRELSELSARFPDLDIDVLDWTAAALELSFDLPQQTLPDASYAKALQRVDAFFTATAPVSDSDVKPASTPLTAADARPETPPPAPEPNPTAAAAVAEQPRAPIETDTRSSATNVADSAASDFASPAPHSSGLDHFAAPQKKRGRKKQPPAPPASPLASSRLAWFIAAAALLVAAIGWWPQLQQRLLSPDLQTTITLEDQRAALLRSTDDTIISDWRTGNDRLAAGVSGDVVWSTNAQQGYMRFTGLPANDPAEHQYQLWIIDAERDQRYPVDGGVFNAPITNKTLVVPIKPALRVHNPNLFVVTLEPSGGVVVSDRERLLLTAATQTQ